MEFKTTSRKDDLVSLCYLMFYILNDSKMPGISTEALRIINSDSSDTPAVFKAVRKYKNEIPLQKMPNLITIDTK